MSRHISRRPINRGTEFGGVGNLIQPPPHSPANSVKETHYMITATNPAAGFPNGRNAETEPAPPATKQISK
jgi:hypothetical protein